MFVRLVENVWVGKKKIHKPSVQSPSQKHCGRETSILHTVEWIEEPHHGISGTGIPNKFTLIRPKNAE